MKQSHPKQEAGCRVRVPCLKAILVVLSLCNAVAAPPEVRPDFFRFAYGEVLPQNPTAPMIQFAKLGGAASTGDGGWLTFWWERAPGLKQGEFRLVVRLLPPQFDTAAVPDAAAWNELAAPAFSPDSEPSDQRAAAATGSEGGWLAWTRNGTVKACWISQGMPPSSSAPVTWPALAPVASDTSPLQAVGEGDVAWVMESSQDPVVARVTALAKPSGTPRITGQVEFGSPVPNVPSLVAGPQRCLISSADLQSNAAKVWNVTVDRAGVASPGKLLTLPTGALWIGAASDGNGFMGFWTIPSPSPSPQSLYARPIGPDGDWAAGMAELLLGSLPYGWLTPRLLSGRNQALLMLNSQETSYLWRPGLALAPVRSPYPPTALSDGALLAVRSERYSVLLAERIHLEPSALPRAQAILGCGTGLIESISLAWTRRGLQMVCQVAGYGSDTTGTGELVTGAIHVIGHPKPVPISTSGFSSPAQAWQGDDLELVAYRKDLPPIPGEDTNLDDVEAVLYRIGPDGTMTVVKGPFPVAQGAGSQRGVSVAPYQSGFLAAWREDSLTQPDGNRFTSIRAAYISPTGDVQPPGGRLLDISVSEVSTVSVAEGGLVVWRSPRSLQYEEPSLLWATIFSLYPQPLTYFLINPADQNTAAPQALYDGQTSWIAWRDKVGKRIHVTGSNSGFKVPLAISPSGWNSREPALVKLGVGRTGVLWLNEINDNLAEVWMAVLDATGVSAPVLVKSGQMENNTLVACGDGEGRVGLAVKNRYLNNWGLYSEWMEVQMLAPLVPQNGGLQITPEAGAATGSNRLLLSWETSSLFPENVTIVESSDDLKNWVPGSGGQLLQVAPGRIGWRIAEPGFHSRFYRLRPVMVPGQ